MKGEGPKRPAATEQEAEKDDHDAATVSRLVGADQMTYKLINGTLTVGW